MNLDYIQNTKISELIKKYPFFLGFLENNNLKIENDLTIPELMDSYDEEYKEDNGISKEQIITQSLDYINQMLAFLGEGDDKVESITIKAGQHKDGSKETFGDIKILSGEIVSIVGPTGSGKSRLLADIEWVAQRDTPTNRQILLNDDIPDKKWRFSIEHKLVAQLSQNMNFVMDLSVYEFLELHAKSRMVENIEDIIIKILNQANNLAGEKFTLETPITSLSGGQSRALMIADTAILSKSPIVLIDEIENAGIDRKQALDLLLSEDKIVLMATHDPMLALIGNKRLVIKNGGIEKIILSTEKEREALKELEIMNDKLQTMRNRLRTGQTLSVS